MTPSEYKKYKGFNECKQASKEGGSVAGNTRKELEKKSQEKIVSKNNFLDGGNLGKLKNGMK